MITTLNAIRAHHPCRAGWEKLLRHLNKTQPDDEPLSISSILDSNGISDALWCLQAVNGRDREIRLYAVWCARRVQHMMRDPRSIAALNASEKYARGRASFDELGDAHKAAREVAEAAEAERAAAAWSAAAWAAAWSAAAAAQDVQAAELRRVCREIEAGRDPYPEENGR